MLKDLWFDVKGLIVNHSVRTRVLLAAWEVETCWLLIFSHHRSSAHFFAHVDPSDSDLRQSQNHCPPPGVSGTIDF